MPDICLRITSQDSMGRIGRADNAGGQGAEQARRGVVGPCRAVMSLRNASLPPCAFRLERFGVCEAVSAGETRIAVPAPGISSSRRAGGIQVTDRGASVRCGSAVPLRLLPSFIAMRRVDDRAGECEFFYHVSRRQSRVRFSHGFPAPAASRAHRRGRGD